MQSTQSLKWQSEPKNILDLYNPVKKDQACMQIPKRSHIRYPDFGFVWSVWGSLDVMVRIDKEEQVVISCLDCDNRLTEERLDEIFHLCV